MPWYVVGITAPLTGTGNVKAVVQFYPSAKAYEAVNGTTPANSGIPGETNAGFATKDEAQKVADRFNKSPTSKHATGAAPAPGSDSIIPPLNSNPISGWLNSLGGEIGAGLEAAAVAFLKDLWDVILGPLEIIAGVVLGIIVIAYIFKDDLIALAPVIAGV